MNDIDRSTQLRDDILYYLHSIYDDVKHPIIEKDFKNEFRTGG